MIRILTEILITVFFALICILFALVVYFLIDNIYSTAFFVKYLGFDENKISLFYSGIAAGILPLTGMLIGYMLWRKQRRHIAYADFSFKHCSCILKALNFMVQNFKRCEIEFSDGMEGKENFIKNFSKEMAKEERIINFNKNKLEYDVYFKKDRILKEINFIYKSYYELGSNFAHYNKHIYKDEIQALIGLIKDFDDKLEFIEDQLGRYMRYSS